MKLLCFRYGGALLTLIVLIAGTLLTPAPVDAEQNLTGRDWHYETYFHNALKQAMTTYNIPGMSAVVMQRGEVVYAKGFGYADIASQKAATPDTIYRLASVSKAFAGVLAIDMQTAGLINLSQPTRFYVPSAPVHHTHTVAQTVTMRSGIGHYDDHGQPAASAQYDTALAAYGFFWNQPLIYTPGAGYKYTTHAYTALGAALEAVSDDATIAEIVQTRIADQYNLPTIRAEDRSIPLANRATIYTSQNAVATPDNLSWKILGGGMEGSATELALFGDRLLRGQILSETDLELLWTPPDNLGNYGYGWAIGQRAGCSLIAAKSGSQLGSTTHMVILPELETVIVVLINRWTGGTHEAAQLGNNLATQILNYECVTGEMLTNAGFETAGSTKKLAADWKEKTLVKAARKENKPAKEKFFAYSGQAAFQFKGLAGSSSTIGQKVSFFAQAGDTITFSAWVKGKNLTSGSLFKAVIKLENDDKEVLTLTPTSGTTDYTQYSSSVVLDETVAKVKISLGMKNGAGSFLVDDVSLTRSTAPLRWQPVPQAILPLNPDAEYLLDMESITR